MRIKIIKPSDEIEAEETIEKTVKPYGKGGAHITMPKRWIGYKVIVVVKSFAGSWAKGMKKHSSKKGQF